MVRYEDTRHPRLDVRIVDGEDEIAIRADRPVLTTAFLSFWLCGWTVAGEKAVSALVAKPNFFLLFWLGGWAVGWIWAVSVLAWTLGGVELIAVIDRDLRVRYRTFGWTTSRTYHGRDIRRLEASGLPREGWPMPYETPFLSSSKSGGVKFCYGARTVYVGIDLDEPDARHLLDLLAVRLPAGASIPA